MKKNINLRSNRNFIDSSILNTLTFYDYLERLEDIALSMFEWVNLPNSMDGDYLEKTLYYYGQATILKDKKYGFINTKCSTNGEINIYDLPTKFTCYSQSYQTTRRLFTGLNPIQKNDEFSECILVKNRVNMKPTYSSLELFAYRLYQAERTADINVNAQKTPILILADNTQLLALKNLYIQYDGNQPVIFADKNNLAKEQIDSISTKADFVALDIQDYKKEIWNEALTFLGVNNILVDKKERLITDEANSNNELINLNLQKFLTPRLKACEQFNEKYNIPENKKLNVKLRSDLHNIIKNNQSIILDYNKNGGDNKNE